MFRALKEGLGGLLGRRDWVYLFSLLIPLVVYNLIMKGTDTFSQKEVNGLLEALRFMRSDILFNLGYVLFWIGLFAAFRKGVPRAIVLVLFHVVSLLVVIVTTCANQYFDATGSTLDFSVIIFYLTTLGEIKNIIASETPWYIWCLLIAALLYVLIGPFALTRISWSRRERGRVQPLRIARLAALGLCVIAASLGAMSLIPGVAGANRAFSLSPPVNVLATGIGGPNTNVSAGDVNSLAASSLKNASLRTTPETDKRNVVLIHLESTPYKAVTPYNKNLKTTPYLNKLAQHSLLVDRAYTTTPHTSKAITSVNCGIYPDPETDIIEAQPGGIPVKCLPELLDKQGYKSVFFQSATETFENRPQLTKNFGYQQFYGLQDMSKKGFQRAGYLGYEDDIMLKPSRDWLEKNGHSGPFMATYLGVTPHHEYLAPTRYGRKHFLDDDMHNRYLNAVRYDDFWVHNIIKQYKAMGLYNNTIFIIYGDHGESFGLHGVKGHDNVIHEEGLRVPLIIHDPQRWKNGARISGDTPVNHMDIAPTILDMLNFKLVNGQYPGSSIFDLPKGRPLYFNCRPDLMCMARTQGYLKYIYYYGEQPPEVYNLRNDPTEQHNIVDRFSEEQLKQWRQELLHWHAQNAALFEGAGKK